MALYTISTNFDGLVTPPVLKNNLSSVTSAQALSVNSPVAVNGSNMFPGLYPQGSVITNAVLYGTGLSALAGTLALTVYGATGLGLLPVGTLLTSTGLDNRNGSLTIPMPLQSDTWLYLQTTTLAPTVPDCGVTLSVNYV